MTPIELLRQTRQNVLATIKDLTLDQLNTIPPGFNNNILWNVGHIVITQQALQYRPSGLPMHITDDVFELFKKGSSARQYEQETVDHLKNIYLSMVDLLEDDVASGRFQTFKEYPTSYGVVLRSIEDAIGFNNLHEGVHFGYIMAQKRAI